MITRVRLSHHQMQRLLLLRRRPIRGQELMSAGVQIRIWMMRHGIKSVDIARELEVHRSAISNFLSGNISSQRIRQYLIDKGCPEDLLDRLRDAA